MTPRQVYLISRTVAPKGQIRIFSLMVCLLDKFIDHEILKKASAKKMRGNLFRFPDIE